MGKKNRLLTSVVALALAATMALGGTFAWQSINQTVVNEGSNIVNPGGRLHDDFDGENKDVYVENFASQPIFTRIRLEEYFKVAVNTGHGNRFSQDVIGTAETDGEGNVTDLNYRIFTDYDRLDEENNTITACWELDSEEEPMTSYFQWTMGSANSADAWYMPTFNLNKDSLAADVNGYYNQGLGVISSVDVEGGQYSDYTAYNADSTEKGTEIYDADENTIDEVGKDFSEDNLAQYVTGGNILTKENVPHTAKAIADTRGLISMEKWLEKYDAAVVAAGDEAVDMSELNSYWVYDTDGWVYWSGAIAASETTGRLLDSIEMTERMEDGWYYALNVVAQFITAGDLGQKEGNTGFYDESSGTPPTKNALKLLDAIGVNTTDAKSAEELTKDWSESVTKMRKLTSDEYDLLCDVTNENDSIMHWSGAQTITDTALVWKGEVDNDYRMLRGGDEARESYSDYVDNTGSQGMFRPAFEISNPESYDDLVEGKVVVIGTLYMGDEPVKVPQTPKYRDDSMTSYDSGTSPALTLGAALPDADYQMKAVYVGDGLFICDRCMIRYLTWNQLNAALTAD